MGCSTGLGTAKSEGPDPVLPTLGKAKVDFVVEVVSGLMEGVDWSENVSAGAAVGLGVVVVGGAEVTGLEKKLGTAVLVAMVRGPGFAAEAGMVVVAGLAKKLGTADCVEVGTVVDDVCVGVDVTSKFFAGSLISVVVAVLVVGFGCVEVVEGGVNKLGAVVLMVEVVVVGLNEIVGAGAGEGFFSSAATFFWS